MTTTMSTQKRPGGEGHTVRHRKVTTRGSGGRATDYRIILYTDGVPQEEPSN